MSFGIKHLIGWFVEICQSESSVFLFRNIATGLKSFDTQCAIGKSSLSICVGPFNSRLFNFTNNVVSEPNEWMLGKGM